MAQYDVLNAFLSASIDENVYVRAPEGYEKMLGRVLKLKKALYGLKKAPQLWYNHLRTTLEELSLKQVPRIPCLFSNAHIIVFFYVDDIACLFARSKATYYAEFEQALMERYEVRRLGELKWFLGIQVVRDRERKRIWLLQDSFISKVAAKFGLDQNRKRYSAVPLADGDLPPKHRRPKFSKHNTLRRTGWLRRPYINEHSARYCSCTFTVVKISPKYRPKESRSSWACIVLLNGNLRTSNSRKWRNLLRLQHTRAMFPTRWI
jgi:hypothetical protein